MAADKKNLAVHEAGSVHQSYVIFSLAVDLDAVSSCCHKRPLFINLPLNAVSQLSVSVLICSLSSESEYKLALYASNSSSPFGNKHVVS